MSPQILELLPVTASILFGTQPSSLGAVSPRKPKSVQAQNNCCFVSPTMNSQVAPHFSGCPAASSVASGLFLFSFEVKWGSTSKFIHHHPKTQDSGQESPGPDKAWITPRCPPWVSGFPFLQAAPQVSLTKATPQGAPETGEAVLHPRRKEGGPGSQVLPIWTVLNC